MSRQNFLSLHKDSAVLFVKGPACGAWNSGGTTQSLYLYAATIAVADREASLLMAVGPGSIGEGRLLRRGAVVLSYAPAMTFKASNSPTYQKRLVIDISVSLGVPKDICLFFEQPLTG